MQRFRQFQVGISLLVLGACSVFHGGSRDSFAANVGASPDSVMRIARTQLMHHGYTVITAKDGGLFTAPRPIAKYQASGDTTLRRHAYTLRVETGKRMFGHASISVHG